MYAKHIHVKNKLKGFNYSCQGDQFSYWLLTSTIVAYRKWVSAQLLLLATQFSNCHRGLLAVGSIQVPLLATQFRYCSTACIGYYYLVLFNYCNWLQLVGYILYYLWLLSSISNQLLLATNSGSSSATSYSFQLLAIGYCLWVMCRYCYWLLVSATVAL